MGIALASTASAQVLPGPADASRIRPEERKIQPPTRLERDVVPQIKPRASEAPAGAEDIKFKFRGLVIEGASGTPSLKAIEAKYHAKEGQYMSLAYAWDIADEITRYYRDEGYFLSRAYVPAQDVSEGIITIHVVEGYVGEINFDSEMASHPAIAPMLKDLQEERPLNRRTMESLLLRLNDLPGLHVRAVLTVPEDENAEDGAVTLSLIPTDAKGAGSISIDNAGSRFLGPHEVNLNYRDAFLPLQETDFSLLGTVLEDEMRYGSFRHSIALLPNITFDMFGAVTKGEPGYTLEPLEVRSDSTVLGAGVGYQWIRQRDENLGLLFSFDARNSTTDLLGTQVTEDNIRALRVSVNYERMDGWDGVNGLRVTFSQGIKGIGASSVHDDVSRDGAIPDFRKADFTFSRLQSISDDWSWLVAATGQASSDILYSAEEFGFGGTAFGRAYDSSEITGNQGLAGSTELRYRGWDMGEAARFSPYVFYDIGKVWNDAPGLDPTRSASSAGFGLRMTTDIALAGEIGLAFPLTKSVDTPLYGNNGKNPRLIFSISQAF